ncbi:hypothetical protein C0992_006964 [Termitomyces sp. T32_za158]|nr:hypothetical protein C0992_006964 [Termitomyces sp. T32_za158]
MVLTRPEPRHGNTSKLDDKIEYLESQLQAYKARTSLLQQEYLSLLDTVYESKQRHKEELEQECNARDLAVSRLQTARDCLKAVEAERDDYKEVVLQLIERGAFLCCISPGAYGLICNLQLSNHVDSLLKLQEQPVDDGKSDLAYYNGLLHSLKQELYLERQAHALTRARADILSAQVASRDAALEGWVQHGAVAHPTGGIYIHGKGKGKSIMQRDLDRSEILALHEQTAAHNRLLEQEIYSSFQYVKGTRQTATHLAQQPTSPHLAATSAPSGSIDFSSRDLAETAPLSNASDSVLSYGHGDRPVIAVQRGRSHISPSPHRGRSLSPSHQPPFKPRSRTRSQSYHRPSMSRSSSLTAFPRENVVQDLSDQVRLLSIQIDGLRAEHVALARFIQSQREDVTVTPDVLQRDYSFSSSDTDGEQSFNVDAGTDFEQATAVDLKEHLNGHESGHGIDIGAVRDGAGDGDTTDGGEHSMEIATPLVSTLVTFPMSSEGDDAPYFDEIRKPGAEEDRGDGEIKMIRPRRRTSISPHIPP